MLKGQVQRFNCRKINVRYKEGSQGNKLLGVNQEVYENCFLQQFLDMALCICDKALVGMHNVGMWYID